MLSLKGWWPSWHVLLYLHKVRNKQIAINIAVKDRRQWQLSSIICLYRILLVNYNYCVVLLTHYINICLLHNHIDNIDYRKLRT